MSDKGTGTTVGTGHPPAIPRRRSTGRPNRHRLVWTPRRPVTVLWECRRCYGKHGADLVQEAAGVAVEYTIRGLRDHPLPGTSI